MGSLTNCINIHNLPEPTARKIRAASAEYKTGGMNPQRAVEKALLEEIAYLEGGGRVAVAEHEAVTAMREDERVTGEVEQVKVTGKRADTLRKVAKAFGKEVVFFKGEFARGAVVPRLKDTILINENQKANALFILGHELLHTLKIDRPELYQQFGEYVAGGVTGYKKFATEYRETVPGAKDMEIVEELLSDFSGEQFTDPVFLAKLRKDNFTLFDKIAEILTKLFNQLGDLTGAHFKDIRAAQDALAGVMGEYAAVEKKVTIEKKLPTKLSRMLQVTRPIEDVNLETGQIQIDDTWYHAERVFGKPAEEFRVGDLLPFDAKTGAVTLETGEVLEKVSSDLFQESGANVSHSEEKINKFAEDMERQGGWGDFPPVTGVIQTVTKEDVDDYKEAKLGGYEHELVYSRPLTESDIGTKYVQIENGHNRAYAAATLGIDIPVIDPSKVPEMKAAKFSRIPEAEKQVQVWRSQMTDFLTDKLPGRGDPKTLTTTIESWAKKGLIKAEELEWSGLIGWINEQGRRLNKDEILAYLAENNVRIEEVMKGVTEADIDIFLSDEVGEGYTREEARKYLQDDEGGTKFGQWQLPGGENYREMLLTLPAQKETKTLMQEQPLGPPVPVEVTEDVPRYKSTHWDEPNVLAHIRFNERTDSEGNRVLFIEEIQSDFGQEYRKQLQNIDNSVTNSFKEIVRNMEKTGILKEIC